MSAPRKHEVGLPELAQILGLRIRQIHNLVAEGLPRRKEGTRWLYDVRVCTAWYIQRKTTERRAAVHGADSPQSARARKLTAEARKAELEVQQLEHTLVALDTFETELSGILERIRARLLAAPQKYAPRIVGLRSIPEALAALEPAFAELMTECTRVADDVEAGEHVHGYGARPPRHDPSRRARRAS